MQAPEGSADAAVARYKSLRHNTHSRRAGLGKVAADFGISKSTLSNRVNGKTLARSKAHAYRQNLTPAEELVLVDYIRRLKELHHPASASLARETASLIRHNRLSAESTDPVPIEPLGKSWLQKFKTRHPVVESAYTTHLDQQRIDGTHPEYLQKWFNAVREKLDEHQYPPSHIYNMDETGYAIGSTQSSPCLTTKDPIIDGLMTKKAASGKPTKASNGRQDWVTTLECVSANGRILKPSVIFKAQGQMNVRWLPEGVYWMDKRSYWRAMDQGELQRTDTPFGPQPTTPAYCRRS